MWPDRVTRSETNKKGNHERNNKTKPGRVDQSIVRLPEESEVSSLIATYFQGIWS